MIIRAGSWVRRGLLVLVAAVGLAETPARAQYNPGPMGRLGAPLPQLPPKGAWGEVIMANNKWIVIQNQQGQQFPISMQGVAQFLIRWPTTLDALTPNSLVEAIGVDIGFEHAPSPSTSTSTRGRRNRWSPRHSGASSATAIGRSPRSTRVITGPSTPSTSASSTRCTAGPSPSLPATRASGAALRRRHRGEPEPAPPERPRQQHRDRPPRLGEHQHDASDPRLVVVRQEGGPRLHDAHGSHAQEPGPVPAGASTRKSP